MDCANQRLLERFKIGESGRRAGYGHEGTGMAVVEGGGKSKTTFSGKACMGRLAEWGRRFVQGRLTNPVQFAR
jgi:hypothetical protein